MKHIVQRRLPTFQKAPAQMRASYGKSCIKLLTLFSKIKLLTSVMMLQCSKDLPQELLLATVSAQTGHVIRMIYHRKNRVSDIFLC
jgi:hypothetical protein